MQQIIEYFSVLDWQDVLFAACAAYLITATIQMLTHLRGRMKEKTFVIRATDTGRVQEKCQELFPIESITFQGRQFTRGMRVKVTTIKKNVIEGELIGMNQVNLVCIRTNTQIIAHQLEKIEEMTMAE